MKLHATTILTVRHQGKVAMGGDGQVTLGTAVMKADAVKVRRLMEGSVLCGFAGGSADAFALLERFEARLKELSRECAASGHGTRQGVAHRPGLAAAGGLDGRGGPEIHTAGQRHGRCHPAQ